MEAQTENKMGTMPVNKLLVNISLPMVISMLVQALYNIVDSIFVAQIDEYALTAVSLAFPMQNFMIAVAAGTGVGVNALLSKRLGEKRFEDVNKAANNSVFLAIVDDKTKRIKAGVKNCGNVRNIFDVLENRRVHHIETLFLGIKCNFYREFSVISTHDLLSNNRSSQSGDALLPINQDFFAGGYGSILQFYIRVLPNDDVANRIVLIQGIDQITHLGAVPNKGTLNFRDCDTPVFDAGKQRTDRNIVNIISCHSTTLLR